MNTIELDLLIHTIQINYASCDGQAKKIATKLAEHLRVAGFDCILRDLQDGFPERDELAQASLVVLIAAVRYGKHLPVATQWLERDAALLNTLPFVVISVNLIARKAYKRNTSNNAYLRRLLQQYKLIPVAACAIAGKLDYPRYGWLDRQMIRLIMALTGGPTDPRVSIEFTDWAAVESFACQLREHVKSNPVGALSTV